MERRKVIAGNWKMNMLPNEAIDFITELTPLVKDTNNEVILCVPFTDLFYALLNVQDTNIKIGAQNMHFEESGAYTGEIAPAMLTEMGVKYVVIGHSERREYFGETDETVNKKVKKALEHNLVPIMCCGETLTQREQGVTMDFIRQQVKVGFLGITAEQAKRIIFDRYLAGVDWGWEHFGAIVTIGVKGDSYYVIEEHAAQHKYIGEWIQIAKDIIRRYGNIPFYCDPARTEHIAAFQKAGINAYLANNRVLSGIEEVATLMERQQFFIVYEQCPRFREEIYKYVWKKNTGEPLKENDDVLCAIRYGIHSDKTVSTIQSPEERMKKAKKIRGML